ncbi:MAG: hypothetical protein IT165_09110 [Bryobacterales bacterium]|nr:hypothetical protein [Bryobacterales bacterium]
MNRRGFVSVAAALLAGCKSGRNGDLAEVVNTADESLAPQLLHGFHTVEQGGWRWTESKFALALKPPRRAGSNGATLLLKCSLPESVLAKHKEVKVTAAIDGIPLPVQKLTATGVQDLRWKVPPDALKGKSGVTAEFTVDPFLPPSDTDRRELGLIVHAAGLVK